ALAVELEHLDFDFLAHSDDFAGVLDALPAHVGDVQQAIDAAEIHEGTVVGEVLDHTLDDLAFLQVGEQLFALCRIDSLEYRTTRYHHVVALLVELDEFELQLFAFQVRGVTDGADVDQRTG